MQPERRLPAGLPQPAPEALRHSERVARYLVQRIRANGGRVSFGDYMHQVLYGPRLGYYVAGNEKFGPHGDFVTAPEVSPLFGRVVANQCAEVLAAGGGAILELGAGSGALAASLLERLGERGELPERYVILEVSSELAGRQRELLIPLAEALSIEISWIDRLPERFSGVILANEVADALPVERFQRGDEEVMQQFVEVDSEGHLVGAWAVASDALSNAVADIEADLGRRLPTGYRSEVSLGLPGWVSELVASLENGLFLIFDYGLPRREYYAADRSGGWLRCHFRHHAHESPFIYPGIQDLTAWVDFSAIAKVAALQGFEVSGFVTQAMFLLSGGLDNEFARFEQGSAVEQLELAQQVKRLTLPSEMGETFKCIGLARPGQPQPSAFAHMNRASSL